jgi:hypothetical protein
MHCKYRRMPLFNIKICIVFLQKRPLILKLKCYVQYMAEAALLHIYSVISSSVPDPDVLGIPDPDLLVRGTDPAPDPSIFKQK